MKKLNFFPNLDSFSSLSGDYNVVPIFADVVADTETPVSAFLKIDDGGGDAFLFESVEGGERWGRYSFLGTGVKSILRSIGEEVEIIEDGKITKKSGNPIDIFKEYMSAYSVAPVEGASRFMGGAVGYAGYDMVRYVEKLPDTSKRDLDVYEMCFMLTDTMLVFDRKEHKIKIIALAYVDSNSDSQSLYNEGIKKIEAIAEKITAPLNLNGRSVGTMVADEVTDVITSNFEKEDFKNAVEKTKEYIRAGDVIQTVLSQRFETAKNVEPFDIYRSLRVVNPSPYMFFLRTGGVTVTGSSPEVLVRVEDRDITVRPIAGTRPRGENEKEDRELEKDLLSDPKERAEHIMLVDLGRNDVGRVSEKGTVKVDELMVIERYSHVMHIVSNVSGKLKEGLGAFDAFSACFPAGTLTGAPKIRAMEIIEELEPCRRAIYGGSVGYFDYSGNMDMCITIRTVVVKDDMIYVQSGAGIVADSDSEKEYEETVNKAKGILKSVAMAREGL